MRISKINFFFLALGLQTLVACGAKNSVRAVAGEGSVSSQVTRETYLNGKKFCASYSKITSKEFAREVRVPVDYKDPSKGETTIYTWTISAFDPKKLSLIYLDGGPGGNSHGSSEMLRGEINEIHFDQRGLGCSAPDSYDLYRSSSFYSSLNTIRDMELVRKAYGLHSWTIFGGSYGTVPATMYASKFPKQSLSLILEGTVFRGRELQSGLTKSSKLNLMLDLLNPAQRKAFNDVIVSQDPEKIGILISLVTTSYYVNRGFQRVGEFLKKVISNDGVIDWAQLEEKFASRTGKAFGHPQAPGNVDAFVNRNLFCKELEERSSFDSGIGYNSDTQKFTASYTSYLSIDQACSDVGVAESDEQAYVASDYPVVVPTFYFQGAHDNATLAKAALKHYKNVPQKSSVFLLAQKGGHSPNSEWLYSSKPELKASQAKLFRLALQGKEVRKEDLAEANLSHEPDQKWIMVPKNFREENLKSELDGIQIQKLSLLQAIE